MEKLVESLQACFLRIVQTVHARSGVQTEPDELTHHFELRFKEGVSTFRFLLKDGSQPEEEIFVFVALSLRDMGKDKLMSEECLVPLGQPVNRLVVAGPGPRNGIGDLFSMPVLVLFQILQESDRFAGVDFRKPFLVRGLCKEVPLHGEQNSQVNEFLKTEPEPMEEDFLKIGGYMLRILSRLAVAQRAQRFPENSEAGPLQDVISFHFLPLGTRWDDGSKASSTYHFSDRF